MFDFTVMGGGYNGRKTGKISGKTVYQHWGRMVPYHFESYWFYGLNNWGWYFTLRSYVLEKPTHVDIDDKFFLLLLKNFYCVFAKESTEKNVGEQRHFWMTSGCMSCTASGNPPPSPRPPSQRQLLFGENWGAVNQIFYTTPPKGLLIVFEKLY